MGNIVSFPPARLLHAEVMHHRLFPRENRFAYKVYYLDIPITRKGAELPAWFAQNRFSWHSFYADDHGSRGDIPLYDWVQKHLHAHGITDAEHIRLICMPRIAGYVFNPVSFWCAYHGNQLRAVLCEVNNTFKQTHNYVCVVEDDNWVHADKLFHVSPFLPREGEYRFRFALEDTRAHIAIHYHANTSELQLTTALKATYNPLTKKQLLMASVRCPLVTLKTITLIHWQALKLVSKGIRYIPLPPQLVQRFSRTHYHSDQNSNQNSGTGQSSNSQPGNHAR